MLQFLQVVCCIMRFVVLDGPLGTQLPSFNMYNKAFMCIVFLND